MTQLIDELKITYSDILSLGESNQKMELMEGEFCMSAMPTPQHQNVVINLGAMLRDYTIKNNLGKVFSSVDIYISEFTLLQPDLCFLSHERANINDGKKFNGVPDLVVEILSDSTEQRDRTFPEGINSDKFHQYAIGGAKEYWIVSPDKQQIEVYQNSQRGFHLVKIFCASDTLNSPLFNDIQLRVHKIFD